MLFVGGGPTLYFFLPILDFFKFGFKTLEDRPEIIAILLDDLCHKI